MASEGGSSPFVEHVKSADGSPYKQAVNSSFKDENKTYLSNGGNEATDYEELKKRILYLEYKLNSSSDEKEVLKLNYESKFEELNQELNNVYEEKEALISDQRVLLDANTELNEENEKLRSQLETLESEKNKIKESSKIYELKDLLNTSENENEDLKSTMLKLTKETEMKLKNKDQLIEELENTNEKLNARCNQFLQKIRTLDQSINDLKTSNDKQDEAKARKLYEDECHTQLEYIRELEQKNLDLSNKVRELKSKYEYSEFLKEDKKTLVNKLNKYEDLQKEFDALLVKYENSKRNLNKWESSFDDPREILIKIKTQQIETENNEKLIKDLRSEVNKLRDELMKLKSLNIESHTKNDRLSNTINDLELDILKTKKLNELQKKEISFLNDRLVSLNEENTLILSNKKLQNSNEAANKKVEELSRLCKEYKEEIDKVKETYDSEKANSNNKRIRLENDRENKFKELERELNEKIKVAEALSNQVEDLKKLNDRLRESVKQVQQNKATDRTNTKQNEESRVRVLELKDNPTSRFEKGTIKLLNQLRVENKDLLAKFEAISKDTSSNESVIETIPRSVYDRIYLEQLELQEEIGTLNKKNKRLIEYYSKETRKFNEILFNLLGYKVEILSDTKLKLISKFFNSNEEYIIINLPQSSGSTSFRNPTDKFSKIEIRENDIKLNNADISQKLNNFIKFWIYEKNELSCFLSALNLELFESIDSK